MSDPQLRRTGPRVLTFSLLAALSAAILALWILILGPIALTDDPAHRQNQVTGGISDWLVVGEATSDGSPYANVSDLAEQNVGWQDAHPDAPHPRSPSAIASLLPIRLLPYGSITLGLAVVSSMCLVAGIRLLLVTFDFSPQLTFLIAPLLGLSKPVIQGIAYGTHVPFVLLCIAAGLWCLQHRRLLGGIGVGLATALKLFPGLLIIGIAQTRPRAVLVPALVLLTLVGIGVALPGVELSEAVQVLAASPANYGDRQFDLSLAANAPVFGDYSALAWAVLAVVGMFGLSRRAGSIEALAIGSGLMVLASPIAWPEYQILALPAVLVVWKIGMVGRLSAYVWAAIMALTISGPIHFVGLLLVTLVLAIDLLRKSASLPEGTTPLSEFGPRVDPST